MAEGFRIPIVSDIVDFFTDVFQTNIGEPLTGNTFQQLQPVTDEEFDQLLQHASSVGLDGPQLDRLRNEGQALGASRFEIQSMIDQMIQDNRFQGQADELQEVENEVLDFGRGRFRDARNTLTNRQQRINRLLTTPGAVRSDAEYGALFGEAENLINAQVNQTRRDASNAAASAGLRFAGGARDAITRAEETGTGQRANVIGNIASDLVSRRDATENDIISLGDAETAFESGRIPNAFNIAGVRHTAPASFDSVNRILGPQLAVEEGRRGQSQAAFGQLIGVGQHAADSAQDTIGEIFRSFRGD